MCHFHNNEQFLILVHIMNSIFVTNTTFVTFQTPEHGKNQTLEAKTNVHYYQKSKFSVNDEISFLECY